MNGDTKKPAVAQAQGYFAALAEAYRLELDAVEDVQRVITRGEVADGESALSTTAAAQGVRHWPFFQNAGYTGVEVAWSFTVANLGFSRICVLTQVEPLTESVHLWG